MTTLLSADDLNDFISPGLACVMPPTKAVKDSEAAETSSTEIGQVEIQIDSLGKPLQVSEIDSKYLELAPAQILLADCLACSGCITLAEEVLVAQHSHTQVMKALRDPQKLYVASVSHQVRASLAVAYNASIPEMDIRLCFALRQLGFKYIVGLDLGRKLSLIQEATNVISRKNMGSTDPRPLLLSICPGWVLYAEKTHPEMIPYLSTTKSPQQITGCLLKLLAMESAHFEKNDIYHLSIMPCFDKKLESARPEALEVSAPQSPDVDCVLSAKEIVALFEELGMSLGAPVSFGALQLLDQDAGKSQSAQEKNAFLSRDLNESAIPFDIRRPEPRLNDHSLSDPQLRPNLNNLYTQLAPPNWPNPSMSWASDAGLGLGGYAYTYLKVLEQQLKNDAPQKILHIETLTGRNTDVYEMRLMEGATVVGRAGVVNGFRNIQNLVRKLKSPHKPGVNPLVARRRTRKLAADPSPQSSDEAVQVHTCDYVEIMACPSGCINGGGQINALEKNVESEKQWVDRVLDAYHQIPNVDVSNPQLSHALLQWTHTFTAESGISHARLMDTHFNKVEKPTDPNAVLLGAKW